MFITEETIEKVRNASEITEVISEYVPNLKRAGKDFKGLCPFHSEKTPSFMVSPSKNIWHCFGCNEGGDIFKFVMKAENCAYPDAIRKLAEKKGIPVQTEGRGATDASAGEKRKGLLLLLQRALEFYHKNLLESEEGKAARDYLFKKRMITPETVKKFALGWAPPGGQALLASALKAGFTESDLATCGLIVRSQREGRWMDWFRKRIVFPILDVKGQTIAFGGRIVDDGAPAGDNPPPKYLNSPESVIFQKGKNLYGLFHGSKKIRERKEAILVEGYLDVIACHQAGIESAVAPLGTALTEDQCYLLKRYAERVTLLFDSDWAGDTAASRGAELLLEFSFVPMVARLPEAKDADEYLKKHSADDFFKILSKKVSVVEHRIQTVLQQNREESEVIQKPLAVQSALPLILKIQNEVVRSEMLKLISDRLGVSLDSLYIEYKKLRKSSAQQKMRKVYGAQTSFAGGTSSRTTAARGGSAAGPGSEKPQEIFSAEEELITLLVLYPDLRPAAKQFSGGAELFIDPRCKDVWQALNEPEHEKPVRAEELLYHLDSSTAGWLNRLIFRHVRYPDANAIMVSLLKRISLNRKAKEMHALEKRVVEMLNTGEKSGGGDDLQRYQELAQDIKGNPE